MKILLLLVFLLHSFCANAIHITLVNPSVVGDVFWDRVTYAYIAAAKDLGVKVDVVYGDGNRLFHYQKISALVQRKVKPDYVIFMPYSGNSEATYDLLEGNKISFVTLERTLTSEEQLTIGLPQHRYKYWLGEVFHDNEYAGELLADSLLKAAKASKKPNKHTFSAIGISGTYGGESAHRVDGLIRSINKHSDVKLLQTAPAFWVKEKSKAIFSQMISRYDGTNIDIAWAASDTMALGIAQAAKSHNKDGHIKIGGIDWTQDGIKAVSSGELTASVGGHFMQAAWALIRIFDHRHGKDVFLPKQNKPSYQLEVITQDNIADYQFLMKKIPWEKIDFKQRSLVFNNEKEHDFSIKSLVNLLN